MAGLPHGRGFRWGPNAANEQGESDAVRRDLSNLNQLKGRLIEDVALVPHEDNVIVHKLGRKPKGYLVVKRQTVPASILVYRNAAGTQATGWNETIMDTISQEEHGGTSNFNTTTGRFTCPVDGFYRVEFSAQFSGVAAGTTLGAAISHNGARARESDIDSTGAIASVSVGCSGVIRCTATDYLAPMVYQNTAGAITMANGSAPYWMSIQLVEAPITDRQASNTTPELTLWLRAPYTQTVSLWVF